MSKNFLRHYVGLSFAPSIYLSLKMLILSHLILNTILELCCLSNIGQGCKGHKIYKNGKLLRKEW